MVLNIVMVPEMNIPMVAASSDALLSNTTQLPDLIVDNHAEIINYLNQYGAILFRGFACQEVTYFSEAIARCNLGYRCSTHDYDLARTVLLDDIYTSSDLPGHIALPLHHEKPRSKNPPNHIYFCCVIPPEKEGGTFFAKADAIWLDMPESVQNKIYEHGVVYKQVFYGRSANYKWLKKTLGDRRVQGWFEHFGTDNKKQIEKQLADNELRWNWINRGQDLIVLNYLPGVKMHPLTNQTLWFNSSAYLNHHSNLIYDELNSQAFFQFMLNRYLVFKDRLPIVCHYGNGQPFSYDDISKIKKAIQNHTTVFTWEKGDFMIVDNFTFMHGKQPHHGSRLLYSCMTRYAF